MRLVCWPRAQKFKDDLRSQFTWMFCHNDREHRQALAEEFEQIIWEIAEYYRVLIGEEKHAI